MKQLLLGDKNAKKTWAIIEGKNLFLFFLFLVEMQMRMCCIAGNVQYEYRIAEVGLMKESQFQRKIKMTLEEKVPGCIVYKTDARQYQGSPDLLVLYKDKWAALEVKRSKDASHRPNQDQRVRYMNEMSYASFVYPENFEEVMDDLARLFQA